MDELSALCAEVKRSRFHAPRGASFTTAFDVQADCPPEELRRAARTSVALDAFVARHELGRDGLLLQGLGQRRQ